MSRSLAATSLGAIALAVGPAHAQTPTQQARATGPCGNAVVASGAAQVNIRQTCYQALAPAQQRQVDRLVAQGREQGARLARGEAVDLKQDDRLARLEEQLARAVDTIATLSAAAGATPAQKQAEALLAAGDVSGAVKVIGEAAEAQLAAADKASTGAAQLYLQQAALLQTRDVAAARVAAEKALAIEPGNFEALWSAGDLAVLTGDTATALRHYDAMLVIARAAAARDASDAAAQRNLAVSLTKSGELRANQGDTAAALGIFREAEMVLRGLLAREPQNREWRRDLVIIHRQTSDVQERQGDMAAALRSARDGLKLAADLAKADPPNGEKQLVAIMQMDTADIVARQGEYAAALATYRDALQVIEQLAAQDPANLQLQRDAGITHQRIGDMLDLTGDTTAAIASYERSSLIVQRLNTAEGANVLWKRDAYVLYQRMGDMLTRRDDPKGALQAHENGLALAEKQTALDPGNIEWQRDLGLAHGRVGDARLLMGDAPTALLRYRQSLDVHRTLAARDSGNAQWQQDLAGAYVRLGVTPGQPPAERRAALRSGISIIDALLKAGKGDATLPIIKQASEGVLQSLPSE